MTEGIKPMKQDIWYLAEKNQKSVKYSKHILYFGFF